MRIVRASTKKYQKDKTKKIWKFRIIKYILLSTKAREYKKKLFYNRYKEIEYIRIHNV